MLAACVIFLSTCYRVSLGTSSNSFLVKNNEIVNLFRLGFVCSYLDFVIGFFGFSTNRYRVLDLNNVFQFFLNLLLVFSRILDKTKSLRPFKTAFFSPLNGLSSTHFCIHTLFFEKILDSFKVFYSVLIW